MAVIVKLPEKRVAYASSFGHPSKSDAFTRLEEVVPLKGNRFFATFEPRTQEYRACVVLKEGQSGETYGLPEGVLAGGAYATARLTGEFADIVRSIGPRSSACVKNTRRIRNVSRSSTTSATRKCFCTCRSSTMGGGAVMKNTKKCPKCQSSDIVLVPGRRENGGAGNLISVSRWNIFSVVKPTRHICGSCGYMENWLMSRDDIARVRGMYVK